LLPPRRNSLFGLSLFSLRPFDSGRFQGKRKRTKSLGSSGGLLTRERERRTEKGVQGDRRFEPDEPRFFPSLLFLLLDQSFRILVLLLILPSSTVFPLSLLFFLLFVDSSSFPHPRSRPRRLSPSALSSVLLKLTSNEPCLPSLRYPTISSTSSLSTPANPSLGILSPSSMEPKHSLNISFRRSPSVSSHNFLQPIFLFRFVLFGELKVFIFLCIEFNLSETTFPSLPSEEEKASGIDYKTRIFTVEEVSSRSSPSFLSSFRRIQPPSILSSM